MNPGAIIVAALTAIFLAFVVYEIDNAVESSAAQSLHNTQTSPEAQPAVNAAADSIDVMNFLGPFVLVAAIIGIVAGAVKSLTR